jgi:uncharacterized damage-inducible protein DinB
MTWLEIAPPETGEYDAYYKGYIDRVESRQLSLILRQQRANVLELLDGLSEERANYRYAPEKWSVKEVLGHLIDTERVFVYRAMSIARGEKQSLPGFDQDDYVRKGDFDRRTVASLQAEYEAVRNASIAFFESLDEADWPATGTANGVTVSVRAIGYIVPGHEAHHLSILEERYLTTTE